MDVENFLFFFKVTVVRVVVVCVFFFCFVLFLLMGFFEYLSDRTQKKCSNCRPCVVVVKENKTKGGIYDSILLRAEPSVGNLSFLTAAAATVSLDSPRYQFLSFFSS